VARLVHRDEALTAEIRIDVADGDAEAAEENTAWLVSMSMMSLYLVTDQYGPNMLSLV
jgi:hypothetical protein